MCDKGDQDPPVPSHDGAAITVAAIADRDDLTMAVFAAARDLRRGISMRRLRQVVYGDGPESLDLSQSDTLNVVVESVSCRVSDLASTLRIDPSTITRSVERLEQAGLVERSMDPNDRRVVLVRATPLGLTFNADYITRTVSAWKQVLRQFDDEELTDLIGKIRRIVSALDEIAEAASVAPWPIDELGEDQSLLRR